MIYITPAITINERDLEEEFLLSSGPGGQNVNKNATAVRLRFTLTGASTTLPDDVCRRLVKLAGSRMTDEGVLIIVARRFRNRERNRRDALDRLIALIRQALKKPKYRRKTTPTLASKKRRLEIKQQRGTIKHLRRGVTDSEE